MKAKIIIFTVLILFGFLLSTLGNISYPLFFGASFFWPVSIIGTVGSIFFGWTGVLAATIFPIFSNLAIGQSYSSVLLLTPSNFLQSYLAFYLFRKLNCDINLKGTRSMLLFSIMVVIVAQLSGGLLFSFILLTLGKVANIMEFIKIIFVWVMTLPWIIIFGIPIIKIFTPILKEYGFLFGQPDTTQKPHVTDCKSFNKNQQTISKGLPIFLKIFSSLLIVGVVPVSILGAYEIIISKANAATLNMNAVFICFGFFATLILTGILTSTIISPIKKLSHGIEKITAGDYDHKVETTSNDELGQLAAGFNDMARTVKENIKQKETYAQLAAVGQTTSLVAHDVRKPFNMLKTMLQVFPTLTPKQTKQYSEDLDVTIRKVEAMLADIMEASREMKYELVPENILSILDLAIKDISRCYPDKNIDFYYNLDTFPLVRLDEQRLCRAFENIITNSFDVVPENNGFMWFSAAKKGKNAEITIGNSHSHIPKNKMELIFQDRFTSGKKSGTGLGLSIVTKIIAGHTGTVSARNVKNAPDFVPENRRNIHGVEFVVTLPLTNKRGYSLKDPVLQNSGEAKAKVGMAYKKSQLAGSSEIDTLTDKLMSLNEKPNMLILDDESIYRMRVRDVLGSLGELNKLINIYDAAGYSEAIELLNHTQIDYLICDIDLAEKTNTGFSVLSETKRIYPDSKVLMHTNRKEAEDIDKAKVLGACGFCPKPITEAILVDFLLEKELWPGRGKKRELVDGQRQKADKYIDALPGSKVLIVNDDPVGLQLNLIAIKSHIDPKDNALFYTAKNYQDAQKIIDSDRPNILISDYNLESSKNGIDVCKLLKEKNKNAVSVIYSGMAQNELNDLKEKDAKWVDEAFSTSRGIKDALEVAFKSLKSKHSGATIPYHVTPDNILRELISHTFSILFKRLKEITVHVEKAPEMLNDLLRFKEEFSPVIEDINYIVDTHNSILDHFENGKKTTHLPQGSLLKIKKLLNSGANNKTNKETSEEYLKILHFLRHDITSNIAVVRNFIIDAEMFVEKMGPEANPFARENAIKLQGLNQAIITLEEMLGDSTFEPKAENIRLITKNIIKKYNNKILSIRNSNQTES